MNYHRFPSPEGQEHTPVRPCPWISLDCLDASGLAQIRQTRSGEIRARSSLSVTVPSSWEESVVSGAITNRFAISRPQLNRNGDQTTIHKTPNIPQIERQFTSYVRV